MSDSSAALCVSGRMHDVGPDAVAWISVSDVGRGGGPEAVMVSTDFERHSYRCVREGDDQ